MLRSTPSLLLPRKTDRSGLSHPPSNFYFPTSGVLKITLRLCFFLPSLTLNFSLSLSLFLSVCLSVCLSPYNGERNRGGGRKVEGMFVATGVECFLPTVTRRFEKKKKRNEEEDGSRGGMEKREDEEAMEQRKKRVERVGESFIPLSKVVGSFYSFSPSPSRSSLSLSLSFSLSHTHARAYTHTHTHTRIHFFCFFFFSTFCRLFPPLLEERDILLGVFPIVVVFGFVFPAKFPAYKLLPPFCLEFSLVSPLRFPLFLFFFLPLEHHPRATDRRYSSRSYGFLSLINYRVELGVGI